MEDYIPDFKRWWANGNIICNADSPSFWGDSYLPQLRDMLESVCAARSVADCEFFINKRDFPHLKVSPHCSPPSCVLILLVISFALLYVCGASRRR